MRVAMKLSLALILALGMSVGLRAESPAEESAKSDSRAAKALEKAAKQNKYLFIFFFDKEDEQTGAMYAVLQKAMEKMKDRANSISINIADPAEKPIVDKFRARGRIFSILI